MTYVPRKLLLVVFFALVVVAVVMVAGQVAYRQSVNPDQPENKTHIVWNGDLEIIISNKEIEVTEDREGKITITFFVQGSALLKNKTKKLMETDSFYLEDGDDTPKTPVFNIPAEGFLEFPWKGLESPVLIITRKKGKDFPDPDFVPKAKPPERIDPRIKKLIG